LWVNISIWNHADSRIFATAFTAAGLARKSNNIAPLHYHSKPTVAGMRSATKRRATISNENENIGEKQLETGSDEKDESDAFVLNEVNVRHGTKISLVYDPTVERYVDIHTATAHLKTVTSTVRRKRKSLAMQQYIKQTIFNSFVPEGITSNYYTFIKWRIIQRFLSANVNVFGTQSLLMGLGIKSNTKSVLGLSAALNWVIKDALGKIVRMIWASKMGRKFDPDAKRWRFRSSLLFAIGNGFEVLTYVYPSMFLVLATIANSLKQMSMLTSSSTRNAVYNSFASKENIGDITAKGEAQIAFVDLFGIASGVMLSKYIGTSVKSVLSIWIVLQFTEIYCVYKQLRAVVFRMLNFERLWKVTNYFLDEVLYSESTIKGNDLRRTVSDIRVPTPDQLAEHERIFLPPDHLARRAISFGSFGRAKLEPDELHALIDVFRHEKFLLVVGQDMKNKHPSTGFRKDINRVKYLTSAEVGVLVKEMKQEAQENCHIVLHVDATNSDIVKSTLALAILRRKLSDSIPSIEELEGVIEKEDGLSPDAVEELIEKYGNRRSKDCMDLVQSSQELANQLFGTFLKVLSVKQWATPARFMFGRVSLRAEWSKPE